MYFQAVYILSNFWKFWVLGSPFVKANLAFGLIYFAVQDYRMSQFSSMGDFDFVEKWTTKTVGM